MNTDTIEKLSTTPITQSIMSIIRKHASENKELEKDLFDLMKLVENYQDKVDDIRSLAYIVANKL